MKVLRRPQAVIRPLFLALAAVVLVGVAPRDAASCPFCSAVSLTFSEEMANSDIVVIAKIAERAAPLGTDAPLDAPAPLTGFEVVEVLKGEGLLAGEKRFKGVYFGQDPDDTRFLLMGIGQTDTQWSTPIALSDRSVEYLVKLPTLPQKGPDRLAFFQEHFEDQDDLLARDAYDEFARASYAEIKEIKDRMPREKLLAWIDDPKIMTSHRRLYLCMLSVCGQPEDIDRLEKMITSNDREVKTALDALIGCYLALKGPDGMPLIEELFIKNPKAEYVDTYSAIMALRFQGQESNAVPKERLLVAMRYMLDRPDLADLVIPDLARWEDWTVMDRLVELFKNADEKSSWVRVPVINYLRVCPLPEAKGLIDELAQIDPDAVERANSFFPLATGDNLVPPADGAVPPADGTPVPSTAAQQAADAAEPGDAAPAGAESAAADDLGNPSLNDPLGQALADEALSADDLPPAPVAEEEASPPSVNASEPAENDAPAASALTGTPAAPASPVAEPTALEAPSAADAAPEPAAEDTEPTETAAVAPATSRPAPAATSKPPTGWMVYVAPLIVAGVLFAAFQALLKANRPGSAT